METKIPDDQNAGAHLCRPQNTDARQGLDDDLPTINIPIAMDDVETIQKRQNDVVEADDDRAADGTIGVEEAPPMLLCGLRDAAVLARTIRSFPASAALPPRLEMTRSDTFEEDPGPSLTIDFGYSETWAWAPLVASWNASTSKAIDRTGDWPLKLFEMSSDTPKVPRSKRKLSSRSIGEEGEGTRILPYSMITLAGTHIIAWCLSISACPSTIL